MSNRCQIDRGFYPAHKPAWGWMRIDPDHLEQVYYCVRCHQRLDPNTGEVLEMLRGQVA